jgi:carboxyl-terminal processing protease
MKLTMARYYTPSDVNIDKIGIPPDYEIKNIETMTPEEEEAYTKLIQSNIVSETGEKSPNMKESDIALAASVIAKTYPIEERLIRRLLRIQVQRTQTSPLYDLDYDIQLAKAIEIIQNNDFNELMRKTKTLKELQESALADETTDSK